MFLYIFAGKQDYIIREFPDGATAKLWKDYVGVPGEFAYITPFGAVRCMNLLGYIAGNSERDYLDSIMGRPNRFN